MDPPENKNLPFSNKQEELKRLSPIDELLGKQKPDVGYVQDGATKNSVQPSPIANHGPSGLSGLNQDVGYVKDVSMKGSVDGGRKPELPSCASSLHEKNASNEQSLLPSHYTSDSQRCVLPINNSYVIALPALNKSSATETESSSNTSSLLLFASEEHCLSQVPASAERYLGPSKIEVPTTKDFTQSLVHIARSSARKPESPSSPSCLLPASQGHRLSLIPTSTERHFGPFEIEVQATKHFSQSPVHIARSSARKPESPSGTSSLLLSAGQGHRLPQVPASTERHLGPSVFQFQATKDFTPSSVHIARPSTRKLESPSSTSSLLLSDSQRHHLSPIPASMERHLGPSEIEVQATKNFTQSSVHITGENFGQNTPKRKRKVHSSDLTEERGSCRNCNCMMSNCLKPYCECFAAGVYCAEPCTCKECLNKPIDEYITLLQTRRKTESSGPHLLVPKVIRSPDTSPQIEDNPNKSPASKICKTVCHCKKIGCHMKSCSCSKGCVGCSINCKCEGCENIYSRKDSTTTKII
ncbi:hypothetical protein TSUD_45840 [Trifolium subterraneum]|nr:hypothetical protein TSUD_45840 [Trifolium subterraneum]